MAAPPANFGRFDPRASALAHRVLEAEPRGLQSTEIRSADVAKW
jgi:hypothetical protein